MKPKLPQFPDFPGLIADVQVQTVCWDFSDQVPIGGNLTGTPVVTATLISDGGAALAPGIVVAAPQIVTDPDGAPNCAVAAQLKVTTARYKLEVSCPAVGGLLGVTDNAAGFNHIEGFASF